MMQQYLVQVSSQCQQCLNTFPNNPSQCNSVCISGVPGSRGYKVVNPLLPIDLQNLSGAEFFANFFPSIIGLILTIGSIAFFFMLLIGGVQWIFSGGDKGKVEEARGRITNAVIGLVVLFAAFAIATLVETFLNVNILTIDIGPLKL